MASVRIKKIREKDIQKSILDYLRFRRIFCWKNNTVGIYKKDTGHYIPSQSVGSPDIFAVKDAKIYGIEVKAKGGKLSEKQRKWAWDFEEAGGIYLLAYSLEDLKKVVD